MFGPARVAFGQKYLSDRGHRLAAADADGVISLGETIAACVADEIMMVIVGRRGREAPVTVCEHGYLLQGRRRIHKRDAVKGIINHHEGVGVPIRAGRQHRRAPSCRWVDPFRCDDHARPLPRFLQGHFGA